MRTLLAEETEMEHQKKKIPGAPFASERVVGSGRRPVETGARMCWGAK